VPSSLTLFLRRFKKNVILQDVYEMVVEMNAVLPKETERELQVRTAFSFLPSPPPTLTPPPPTNPSLAPQLQTQNIAIERAQAEAEALFMDGGSGKTKKGSKGLTMDSFMGTQSTGGTQKAKRSRR
jgi:hypothetical protein